MIVRRGGPGARRGAVVALAAAVGVLLLIGAPGADAHETAPTGVERMEVSLGARQLVVAITVPPAGGGRMPVVVLPRGDTPPGTVRLTAVPAGAAAGPGTPVPAAPAGRVSEVDLETGGPGAWEVVLTDAASVARIPVAVAAPDPTPGWVWAVRVGAVVGIVALVAAVSPPLRRRRWWSVPIGALAVVGLSVAVTAAALGPSIPVTPAPVDPAPATDTGMDGMSGMAGMTSMAGMPAMTGAVVGTVATGPGVPVAGRPVELRLGLTDGSTGAVVDDLSVHDDALIHLAVVGPDGQLLHLHPARVAPGRYVASLVPGSAGRWGVFAEMQRAGEGGHQVVRSTFDVTGPPSRPVAAPGPGGRQLVAGLQVDVAAPDAVAGRPTHVSMTVADHGAPVTDLQSWLAMAGHVIVLGPGRAGVPDASDPSSSYGHVHDMSPPNPNGRYGPRIGVDYTFPRAGRYRLWIQVQRDWQIVTVPVTVDVRADPGRPGAG